MSKVVNTFALLRRAFFFFTTLDTIDTIGFTSDSFGQKLENPLQGLHHRRIIRIHLHDIRHVIPPFAHDGQARKQVYGMINPALLVSKKMPGAGLQKDLLIQNPRLFDCRR